MTKNARSYTCVCTRARAAYTFAVEGVARRVGVSSGCATVTTTVIIVVAA